MERKDNKYEKKKAMMDDFSKIYLLKQEDHSHGIHNHNNNIFFYAYKNNKSHDNEKLNKLNKKERESNNIVGYLPLIIVNNLLKNL